MATPKRVPSPTTITNVTHDHKRTDTSPEAQRARTEAAIQLILKTQPPDAESPESMARKVARNPLPRRAGAIVTGRRKDNPPV